MLTRYSKLKDLIAETEVSIRRKREEVNDKQALINNLRVKLKCDQDERESKVKEQIQEILESKIAEKKNLYEYDRKVLAQFKFNQLEKLDLIRARVQSPDNIDSADYKNNFAELMKLKDSIETELGKYLTDNEINYYKDLGYGRKLVSGDINQIADNMSYLYELDNYDDVKVKLVKVDNKVSNIEVNVAIVFGIFIIAIMVIYKYIIFLPLFAYLLACIFIRVRHFYYLLEVVDAYNVIGEYVESSINTYDNCVTQALAVTLEKLDAAKTYIEQICNSMEAEINKSLDSDIRDIRLNFDYEKAKVEAEKSVDISDNHLEETIKSEQDEYDDLMEELISLNQDLDGYKDNLVKLKQEINSVYQKLEPSFSEKLILKEFFLGFDSVEEPVTFKYGGKSTLILYDGTDSNQINYVMTTIKMMCGQIMCSMYPLSYTINVIDCYTSGVSLAPFQVKEDEGDNEGDTSLFKITATGSGVKHHIDALYSEFENRRVNILGSFVDVEEYNIHKMKYNARTIPYYMSFFYNFDYNLFKEDEKLHQLCRVSQSVGIVPIVFMDISQFGVDDKQKGIKFKYQPEIIIQTLDLFDSNVFGFKITKEGVDILNYDVEALKRKFRR